ncbi:MAG: hypothetical protein DYG85_14120 [Chloroflexi bacterium CFX1]|nr:hypothetical protein [Chloroflexi bacterium CFX1]
MFGQSVDEVEVEVIEPGFPRGGYGFDDREEIVRAFEQAQFFSDGGLNAETDSVDSCAAIFVQFFGRGRAGVGFDGDLRVRG